MELDPQPILDSPRARENETPVAAPIKIFINGRFLTQAITGVQRFALETVRALDALLEKGGLDAGLIFEILVPHDVPYRFSRIPVTTRPVLRGHAWEQVTLPLACRNGVLINLCNTAPVAKRRQAVVIHDASVIAAPLAYSATFRRSYQLLFQLLRWAGVQTLTVSAFSRAELSRHCGFSIRERDVLFEGAEHILDVPADAQALTRWGLRQSEFVLAVGSRHANKNFATLLKAIELLPPGQFDVVIAGGANRNVFEGGAALPAWVKQVGFVSDETLRALYEAAGCFVFPSLYEGFGLPVLEAMKCGCPVIASKAAAIPEICGPAALYFDTLDAADLSVQISRMMLDPALRAELSSRGRHQADRFQWELTAHRLIASMSGLAGRSLLRNAPPDCSGREYL